jgi:2-dehydro-3-deoxyphosphogluconate aldolase/(4S)-4-hydroxy-2-oxoglutarate aldolase
VGRSAPDLVMAALMRDRFIPVIRTGETSVAADRLEGMIAAGAEVIELTATIPGALELLGEYTARVPALGLGSLRGEADARAAAQAGAAFLVTPAVAPGVIRQAHAHDAVAIVGAFTPTEILTAWNAGADAVKWFPASIGGVRGLRELRSPLPDIPLIPTGGVNWDNAEAYLAAGAVAIGVGSALDEAGTDVTQATRAWLTRCRRPASALVQMPLVVAPSRTPGS